MFEGYRKLLVAKTIKFWNCHYCEAKEVVKIFCQSNFFVMYCFEKTKFSLTFSSSIL